MKKGPLGAKSHQTLSEKFRNALLFCRAIALKKVAPLRIPSFRTGTPWVTPLKGGYFQMLLFWYLKNRQKCPIFSINFYQKSKVAQNRAFSISRTFAV